MMWRSIIVAVVSLGFVHVAALGQTPVQPAARQPPKTGSVIFIHPDGAGLNTWTAARMLHVGPDGTLNWDRLPNMAVYRGHMNDQLTGTSHGGGTAHAWGAKGPHNSFGGRSAGAQTISGAGTSRSIMMEAKARGRAVGVINSASIVDAGTGVFLAGVDERKDTNAIAAQMLAQQPDVLLGGGERSFIPKGFMGRHGEGERDDGRNLIDEARAAGYTVVFTRDELASLAPSTTKVLGLFASGDTFNDQSEESLREKGLPEYSPTAPTVGEMLAAALIVFDTLEKPFIVVAEEEGSDNFPASNNARATLHALKRADDAIGVALDYLSMRPDTLVLTVADSDCGGLQALGVHAGLMKPDAALPPREEGNGAPLDGRDGTGTPPFIAGPDRMGRRLPFAVAWAGTNDLSGGIIARAAGLNGNLLSGSIDNTGIYRLMYATLFAEATSGSFNGVEPPR